MRRLRILLTEGSSLTARQTLYALGRAGHALDVCDPRPFFCLANWSRYVGTCHPCPPFGAEPLAYLERLLDLTPPGRYDVLLPTHEQVYLLSRFRDRFAGRVALAVPEFAAIERLQSKAEFARLLDELNLPSPPTTFARTRADIEAAATPCYVKLAYSTAGCGVWLARDAGDLRRLAADLEAAGHLDGGEVLVQAPGPGTLSVAQTVFQHGRLVAGHCYRSRASGAGGSAGARVGVLHPHVLAHMAALGEHLAWHGALTVEYLHDDAGPAYIDANPRLGETFNGVQSGIDLCAALVRVSLGEPVAPLPPGRPGVKTHNLINVLLGLAQRGATRRRLLGEAWRAWTGCGDYADSTDELTRPGEDPPSVLPAGFVLAQLLASPALVNSIVGTAVGRYSLDATTARTIRAGNSAVRFGGPGGRRPSRRPTSGK